MSINRKSRKAVRPIRIEGNIAYVTLTKGYEAIIDAEDAHLVEGFNWHAKIFRHTCYAKSSPAAAKVLGSQYMHRIIAKTPINMITDHIDRNGLNNKKDNLRHATGSENNCNTEAYCNNKSGIKGVHWCNTKKRWKAQVRFKGYQKHLGYFRNIEDAKMAREEGCKLIHKEFARVTK